MRLRPWLRLALHAFLVGLVAGALARLLFWSRIEASASSGGYGLSHYLAGFVVPLLKLLSPVYGVAFPSFFTGYELGEWLLGDNPFSELQSFAIGLAGGLILIWLVQLLARWRRRATS
ncbi:hypothetical protein Hbut_0258 [Hyperthermus butylicus DSM 5456]|uniref:Uncharacterized protein n=2 Tax=Hyperthermus butylicus TaxID=54248 RepID=A2BJG9_HYPBU|nr:hypothetical protein Hbut_0258 [Hyperthermus butylicus DSM 5456]